MKRRIIQVAKIRIMDAEVGDVVHRNPQEKKGWFKVAMREVLFNGDLQLSDSTTHVTLSGGRYDLIGVQFAQEVDVPDQAAGPSQEESSTQPQPEQPPTENVDEVTPLQAQQVAQPDQQVLSPPVEQPV